MGISSLKNRACLNASNACPHCFDADFSSRPSSRGLFARPVFFRRRLTCLQPFCFSFQSFFPDSLPRKMATLTVPLPPAAAAASTGKGAAPAGKGGARPSNFSFGATEAVSEFAKLLQHPTTNSMQHRRRRPGMMRSQAALSDCCHGLPLVVHREALEGFGAKHPKHLVQVRKMLTLIEEAKMEIGDDGVLAVVLDALEATDGNGARLKANTKIQYLLSLKKFVLFYSTTLSVKTTVDYSSRSEQVRNLATALELEKSSLGVEKKAQIEGVHGLHAATYNEWGVLHKVEVEFMALSMTALYLQIILRISWNGAVSKPEVKMLQGLLISVQMLVGTGNRTNWFKVLKVGRYRQMVKESGGMLFSLIGFCFLESSVFSNPF
jgi:hypothetical protein